MAPSENTQGSTPFVLTRTIHASRQRVYQAWSEQDHLAKWWGPKGMHIQIPNFEFKPGGKFHYRLEGPNNQVMWGLFVYRDFQAPEKIVYISSFSDKWSDIAKSPFPMEWPLEIHNTVTLEEEGENTKLRLEAYPLNATPAQIESFEKLKPSMTQGFGGTLDQLESHLSSD